MFHLVCFVYLVYFVNLANLVIQVCQVRLDNFLYLVHSVYWLVGYNEQRISNKVELFKVLDLVLDLVHSLA